MTWSWQEISRFYKKKRTKQDNFFWLTPKRNTLKELCGGMGSRATLYSHPITESHPVQAESMAAFMFFSNISKPNCQRKLLNLPLTERWGHKLVVKSASFSNHCVIQLLQSQLLIRLPENILVFVLLGWLPQFCDAMLPFWCLYWDIFSLCPRCLAA